MIRIVVFSALGLLLGSLLFVWLVGRIRYRIGSKQLKVMLFGLPLRRVALTSIESVSKRPGEGFCERWYSTFRPKHRLLVIRRKRGLWRNLIITPKNRYVFKADLEKAIDRSIRHASGGEHDRPEVDDVSRGDPGESEPAPAQPEST